MKQIEFDEIVNKTAALIDSCLKNIEPAAEKRLAYFCDTETEPKAKWALGQIILNAEIAKTTDSYACQDTGLGVFFIEYGNEVYINGLIGNALNQAVKIAYRQGRKSVADPLTRINTGDNTPAIIHTSIVKGDKLKITFLAKGAGSENMSKIYMLTPSKGRQGVIDSVVDCVLKAGANPCPPIIAGIGIGGDLSKCALLSKLALTRETGKPSPDKEIALLESEILEKINGLNIGAAGLGGKATALAVAIETYPTHIGMLPVAVNIQCHSVRHGCIEL